jgi:squalene synthase HpnC
MSRFLVELDRHGPGSPAVASLDAAREYCARLTRTHYENFSVVTWLTPRALKPAFEAIYAFCRWSDDLGDEVGDRDRSTALLSWWRDELRRVYDDRGGAPGHPVMVALAPVVRQYGIPAGPFEALIAAFEQDQRVLRYETYAQVLDYCTRSANPVGELVLYLGGAHTPENVRLSDATCTGLQLANFWQDVARDHDIGRVYLPLEDLGRFGVDEADLAARRFTPAFRDLLAFEVGRARGLLHEGWPLARRMPGKLAVDVDLFSRGGLAILDRIAARGYDVLSGRPEVGKAAKVGLLARSALAAAGRAVGMGNGGPGRTARPAGDT